jgi:hypothetical protein
LYIGDAKMGRAFVQAGGDYYLMPLARKGRVPELMASLLEPVWNGEQPLKRIYTTAGEESDKGTTD